MWESAALVSTVKKNVAPKFGLAVQGAVNTVYAYRDAVVLYELHQCQPARKSYQVTLLFLSCSYSYLKIET